MAFSFELQFRRTRCRKFDEDIDNCPFQASSEKNNVRHTAGPSDYIAEDAAGGRGKVVKMTVPFLEHRGVRELQALLHSWLVLQ